MSTLALRPLSVHDAAAMAGVLADPSLYEYTGGEPPTEDGLRRLYGIQTRGGSADGTERWLNEIVEVDGHPVGYVQATMPTDGGPAEIAWVIGRPWQGRGHAKAATRLLVGRLSDEGVRDLVAHIHPEHHASQRVAALLGLRPSDVVVDGEVRWTGRTRQSSEEGDAEAAAGVGPVAG